MEQVQRKQVQAQAVVIGGGAGGTAAAYTLAKNKIKTILVEKNPGLGGTSVYGGVNCWEPGVASGELHQLIQQKLSAIPGACAVCKTIPNSLLMEPEAEPFTDFKKYPWGLSVPAPEADYEDTLKRSPPLVEIAHLKRFQFEPAVMDRILQELLAEHREYLTVLLQTEYLSCMTEGDLVKKVMVRNTEGAFEISADYFVDSSGDILLARDAGCKVAIGRESKEQYGEPSAGERDENAINGVTYVFRIRKSIDPEHMDPRAEDENAIPRIVTSCFNYYPNGDINVNMLPTLQGREYLALGEKADSVGRATALRYWNQLQLHYGMKGYELVHLFPMAGVRESYRLVGKQVLTEHDLLISADDYPRKEEIAAIADHPRDRHGEAGSCTDVPAPYAIPISCTETREFSNLFVACRGASFSSIAAASARLTRTMLGLGEAVGREITKRIFLTGK